MRFTALHRLALCSVLSSAGCLALNPVGEIRAALESPAVQATLEKWATTAELCDPVIGGRVVNGFEVYVNGVSAEGSVSGDARSGGIDVERLALIMERLAEKVGIELPPATQPSVP
mgnify:CR=1 FL=1